MSTVNRRRFLNAISMLAAGTFIPSEAFSFGLTPSKKLRITLVGTGVRGTTFWGRRLQEQYSEIIEFVGLCDPNPGRLAYAKQYIGADCPTYEDFDQMIAAQSPDLVIVTTPDAFHHEYIIRGLESGCDVLTEKPLTIDEHKCQAILEAERRSDKNLIVGFNYRWSPYSTEIKKLLMDKSIGDITSVDFHWYLNTSHGASYFRRWHGLRQMGGTLWVHKATHHFDLLNWWLDADPEEVFAYGALEYYGEKGPFRGNNCRDCQHTGACEFYWDITKSQRDMDLYANHESHDGYIRDNCLYRDEINIYDKMSAQIRYANDVVVNYSLTTYSPFEGWRIAFNGTKGRIEAWLDIPYQSSMAPSQEELHALEMSQTSGKATTYQPIIVHQLRSDYQTIQVPYQRGGHGGGDQELHQKVFVHPDSKDPYDRAAGVRDGAMSILIGIAARKSIESGLPISISTLTDLEPRARRI